LYVQCFRQNVALLTKAVCTIAMVAVTYISFKNAYRTREAPSCHDPTKFRTAAATKAKSACFSPHAQTAQPHGSNAPRGEESPEHRELQKRPAMRQIVLVIWDREKTCFVEPKLNPSWNNVSRAIDSLAIQHTQYPSAGQCLLACPSAFRRLPPRPRDGPSDRIG